MNRKQILLNLSNHPYLDWEEQQKKAAHKYGNVVDMSFPKVDEYGDEDYITDLAHCYLKKIQAVGKPDNVTIHLMGELTFCFALLKLLQREGYTCIASTSERIVEELHPSQKQVVFKFERFRVYE